MSATEVDTAPLPTEESQVETAAPVSDPAPEAEAAPSTQVLNEVSTAEAPVTDVPAESAPEDTKPDSPSKKGRLAKLFAKVTFPITRNHKKEELTPAKDDTIKKDEPADQAIAESAPTDAEPANVDQVPAEDPAQAEVAPSVEPVSEPTTQPPVDSAQPAESTQVPAESTQAPATDSTQESAQAHKDKDEKKKKDENRVSKVGRRLSARVNDLFKPKAKELSTPPKVDEHPPMIDEPAFVAPLEDPTSSEPPHAEEVSPAEEDSVLAEPAVHPSTPMVAAAA